MDAFEYMFKDFFSLMDELGYTPKQSGEVMFRLKQVDDFRKGKNV